MPDWTKSMEQTYEFFEVDPNSWKEIKPLRFITGCTILRDSSKETLGSASFTSTEDLGEMYVRVYLVTRQNGIKERFPLGTFITQTPEYSYNGKLSDLSIDAYTPLLELKDNVPPLGYTVVKGLSATDVAYTLIRENCRAPLTPPKGMNDILNQDFTADTDDTWLSYTSDLIATANHQIRLYDDCSLYFEKIEDFKSLAPSYRFTDNNSSLLAPDIRDRRDLYGIPNVLEMLYTTDTNDYYYTIVENNDVNSEISIPRRGRKVVQRISNPTFPGNPTEDEFEEYAKQQLKQLSTLEHTITFSYGFVPEVRLGSCVALNYTRAKLNNVRARIISQNIKCETGCVVEATATYTTELWNGD